MAPPAEANEYMMKKMKFVPRMYQVLNNVVPDGGIAFADFYMTVFGDGAIPKRLKELMFTSIGVAYCSPRCLIHVVPAIADGATDGEILEAVAVGMVAAGFVPGGPGIPYAFEYAAKVLDVAAKVRSGEKWEYMSPPQFNHGVF